MACVAAAVSAAAVSAVAVSAVMSAMSVAGAVVVVMVGSGPLMSEVAAGGPVRGGA